MKHIPHFDPHDTTTPQKLSSALQEVDRFVQQGCAEVSALAQLALAWLENPDAYRQLELVARTLETIRHSADSLAEYAGSEARTVNCGFEDAAEGRRAEAAKVAAEEAAQARTVVGAGLLR